MLSQALTFAVLAATAAAQAAFSITTPAALVSCQPAKVSWTGGAPPYILSIIPGGQVGAAALADLSTNLNAHEFTWNTNVVGGTHLTFKIVDSTGETAYSAPVTVQAGSDDKCLTAAGSSAAGGAASTPAAGSSAAASTPAAAGSSAAAGSTTAAGAASSAQSAAASAASSVKSGAASAASSAASAVSSVAAGNSGALQQVAPVAAVVAGVGAAMLF